MIKKYEVNSKDLTSDIKIKNHKFNTTLDFGKVKGNLGQKRACDALDYGMKMRIKGYNIFVSGLTGTGRSTYVHRLSDEFAKQNFDKKTIKDYIYVYNFKNQYEPICIELPAGEGKLFQTTIQKTFSKIKNELTKSFSSTKYINSYSKFESVYDEAVDKSLEKLNKKAKTKKIMYHAVDDGLVSVPINSDGSILSDDDMENLTHDDFIRYKNNISKLSTDLNKALDEIKNAQENYEKTIETFDKEIVQKILDNWFENLYVEYSYNKKIIEYLNDVEQDIIDNLDKFKMSEAKGRVIISSIAKSRDFFDRYKVNLFIDNSKADRLPVVTEINPTYYNLNGYLEYRNKQGSFYASFLDIKSGALHRANGGILIINVHDLLANPYSWDCIKRALNTQSVKIDSLSEHSAYIITTSLKPEKIDLNVKIILIGDYETYDLLYDYDENFSKLFRVLAEFDTQMDNTATNQKNFASTIKLKCEEKHIKQLDKEALFELIRYSNRLAEDKNKLSSMFNKIMDVIYEANFLSESQNEFITKDDIKNALKQKIYRNNMYQEHLYDMYKDGSLLIKIDGEEIGQINGLVVITEGDYTFGSVSKITASSYIGKEGIINIEREIKTSGSSHDKGIMTLAGYIGRRYGKEKNLSFTSSITFEQNYGYIDGDSASSTELYAIFSSIADIPLKQYIAVTGSVSQLGEIQPIGGVNEKIEGFYNICKLKGLTGNQGVIIPKLNVQNLVLNDEVIASCESGAFHIYAISTVDEGLEILTGLNKKQIDEKMNDTLQKFIDYFEADVDQQDDW